MHLWDHGEGDPCSIESYFLAGDVIRAGARRTPSGWRLTGLEVRTVWRTGAGFGSMLQTGGPPSALRRRQRVAEADRLETHLAIKRRSRAGPLRNRVAPADPPGRPRGHHHLAGGPAPLRNPAPGRLLDMSPRTHLPEDEYLVKVGLVAYLVTSVEGLLLFDLPRLEWALPP